MVLACVYSANGNGISFGMARLGNVLAMAFCAILPVAVIRLNTLMVVIGEMLISATKNHFLLLGLLVFPFLVMVLLP
jgi:hypothetical protein